MRMWGIALVLCLLGSGSAMGAESASVPVVVRVKAGGLNVQAEGGPLLFTATAGRAAELSALSAPSIAITDARGLRDAGWHVTVRSTDLLSQEGHRLPSEALVFQAEGGVVEGVSGTALDPVGGPYQTRARGSLASGLKILSSSAGFGMGRFRYRIDPGQFSLRLGEDTQPGDYQGTLTFTVVTGP
ncbi:MAG: hypothetical protein HY319_31400 [Armatimonadetes bacterium]|nr:hypothetical protein [Armatimonadota bacterium]